MTRATHRVGAHLHIQGARFSPARAEAELGIELVSKNEPGERGVKGRYAGEPTPFGAGRWDFDWDSGELLPLSAPLFSVADLKAKLTVLGADSIVLYVHVGYTGQCNLEMSPALLQALAALDVPVGITCYEND